MLDYNTALALELESEHLHTLLTAEHSYIHTIRVNLLAHGVALGWDSLARLARLNGLLPLVRARYDRRVGLRDRLENKQ